MSSPTHVPVLPRDGSSIPFDAVQPGSKQFSRGRSSSTGWSQFSRGGRSSAGVVAVQPGTKQFSRGRSSSAGDEAVQPGRRSLTGWSQFSRGGRSSTGVVAVQPGSHSPTGRPSRLTGGDRAPKNIDISNEHPSICEMESSFVANSSMVHHVPFLCTNSLPRIPPTDGSVHRRLKIIPFLSSYVTNENRDKSSRMMTTRHR